MLHRRLWLVPLLLAITVAGGWYFGFRAKAGNCELPVYVLGSERMLAGEEIYRPRVDDKPFTYPPFAALVMHPLRAVPSPWQLAAWFGLNFVVLLLLVRWLHRWGARVDSGLGPPRLKFYWLLIALLGMHHVLSVFTNQSHDLLIAGCLMVAAAGTCRGGWLGHGLLALGGGMGAAIKATPLLFGWLLLVRGKWLALWLLLAVAAALTLLPDLLTPRADGTAWVVAWYETNLSALRVGDAADAGAWHSHNYLNQSLSGALTRLFSPAPQFAPGTEQPFVDAQAMWMELPRPLLALLRLGALTGVLLLLVLGARRIQAREREAPAMQRTLGFGGVALVACGMLLLSPMSSKAHFCVLLFPAAFLADRLLRGPRDLWLVCLTTIACVSGPLISKDLVGRELGNRLLAFGHLAFSTLVLLLAVVRALRPSARELLRRG